MKYYIYAIKNLVNNKVYVGSTKSAKSRKYSHFYNLKKNTHGNKHLQNSYNKYGKDKFSFYIIQEFDDLERKSNEIKFIEQYKSYLREFGYNVYEPNKDNFKCSDETKSKIRLSHSNSKYSIPIVAFNISDGSIINTFPSMKACAIALNMHVATVHAIINNKRKSHKGMTFRKKEDPYDYEPSNKQRNMSKFYK